MAVSEQLVAKVVNMHFTTSKIKENIEIKISVYKTTNCQWLGHFKHSVLLLKRSVASNMILTIKDRRSVNEKSNMSMLVKITVHLQRRQDRHVSVATPCDVQSGVASFTLLHDSHIGGRIR